MQARVIRVLFMGLLESGVERAEDRVVRPGFARRPRLREFRQPHLQALVHRVRGQQPMDHRGSGARQTGDEDRPLDRHVDVLRVLLERGFRDKTGHQRVTGEEALHLAAELGQIGVALVGLQQHSECFQVVVVVGAEIIQTAGLYRRGMQILYCADIGTRCSCAIRLHYSLPSHALYSPQFTSRA